MIVKVVMMFLIVKCGIKKYSKVNFKYVVSKLIIDIYILFLCM